MDADYHRISFGITYKRCVGCIVHEILPQNYVSICRCAMSIHWLRRRRRRRRHSNNCDVYIYKRVYKNRWAQREMFYCVTDNELHKFCCATETATMNAQNKMSAELERSQKSTLLRMERTNVVLEKFGARFSGFDREMKSR